jgi:hypothetical protein
MSRKGRNKVVKAKADRVEKNSGDGNRCLRDDRVSDCPKAAPDVVVIRRNQTTVFEPQNHRASIWLHHHCGLNTESISGDTEIRVHPERCPIIVGELKAAGFTVTNQKEELC